LKIKAMKQLQDGEYYKYILDTLREKGLHESDLRIEETKRRLEQSPPKIRENPIDSKNLPTANAGSLT